MSDNKIDQTLTVFPPNIHRQTDRQTKHHRLIEAHYKCLTFAQLLCVCTACRPAPSGSSLQMKRCPQKTDSE